jgi:putative endonuclease
MFTGHNYFVYIVECADKTYYTGITNDVDRRVEEHNSGLYLTSYTYSRRPVVLRYFERFQDVTQAIDFEKQVKGWCRKKKEALFIEDWHEIKRLTKKR